MCLGIPSPSDSTRVHPAPPCLSLERLHETAIKNTRETNEADGSQVDRASARLSKIGTMGIYPLPHFVVLVAWCSMEQLVYGHRLQPLKGTPDVFDSHLPSANPNWMQRRFTQALRKPLPIPADKNPALKWPTCYGCSDLCSLLRRASECNSGQSLAADEDECATIQRKRGCFCGWHYGWRDPDRQCVDWNTRGLRGALAHEEHLPECRNHATRTRVPVGYSPASSFHTVLSLRPYHFLQVHRCWTMNTMESVPMQCRKQALLV